jgi:hypothetical protein
MTGLEIVESRYETAPPRTSEAADQILAEGFRDNTDNYGFEGHLLTGVWLSDVPSGLQ